MNSKGQKLGAMAYIFTFLWLNGGQMVLLLHRPEDITIAC